MSPATSTRGQTLWQASRALQDSNVAKPSLDILLFTSQLSRTLGIRGMRYITAVRNLLCDGLYSTGGGSCVCEVEARLEGEYRMIYEYYATTYMRSAAGYGPIAVPLLFARTKRSLGVQAGAATREKRNLTMPLQVEVQRKRAYMVAESLLDQVIYPHSYAEFLESGKTPDELVRILEMVDLAYLPEREGGWTTRKEWRDMGMARLLYHRPKFAVLDECTSAASSDAGGRMYERAKSLGITLITISLSWRWSARWTLSRVGAAEREVISLEARLAEVGNWERRVKELDGLLSAQEPADGGTVIV
ncbi:hypothetical protein PC9H_010641 [Pleurotus ostreatus]|uniref:ABC transporter domain-containing protein n=1 Tax=Pleurotus ostreatus TaxID=5322 RepID=A0A8H6ZK80_PLEOS|nr:uncharacterized protein PC9H_010641 [Pleurotus ostreatus]KAF7422485.1 hypothetical protein PC9H_010641 [Pleurotus ostreatus]